MTSTRIVSPQPTPFTATVDVPGDKSLSHRALLFAGMANGTSSVDGLGPGADIAATAEALRHLGVGVEGATVVSRGVGAWQEPGRALACGNSGTTMRLLVGALAARPFRTILTGDASLTARPMERLAAPIEALGGRIELAAPGTPPITVGPGTALRGARVEIPIASAQVRSAFELAAVQSEGVSHVTSPPGFRDHTERWLETLGLGERLTPAEFRVYPGDVPPHGYVVPGDASSAAYLWAAAAIRPGSAVTTPEVTLNPGRIGFLQVLDEMGAEVEAEVTRSMLGDPVGTVTVRGRALQGVEIQGSLVAATLDELPLVAVVASFAEGVTTIRDAAELRTKESDRITATCRMVRGLRGGAEEASDGFQVLGLGWLEAGEVDAGGDHRIAMAAAVAATGASGPVVIHGADSVAVSWPSFFDMLEPLWSSR
ncbi:MAG: 3-phosphoshikimate 1-carboxyvinyltransferase [Acidimicrobiia bacterium]